MEVGTPKSQNSSLGIRNVFGDDYPYASVWFSSTKHVFLLAEWEGRSWSGAGFYTKMFKKSRTRLCCFQLEVLLTSTHLNTNVLRMIFCAKSWRSGLWLYIYLVQVKSTCHEPPKPMKKPLNRGEIFLRNGHLPKTPAGVLWFGGCLGWTSRMFRFSPCNWGARGGWGRRWWVGGFLLLGSHVFGGPFVGEDFFSKKEFVLQSPTRNASK